MKERPILFSGRLVRAILEGRKSQRRLYVKHGEDPLAPEHIERRIINGIDRIDDHGCWLWGRASSSGYACMTIAGRSVRVHRLVLAMTLGKGERELIEACHRCDVPLCVNPEHLFEGTHGDNVRDAISKGRARPPVGPRLIGEANPAAKLSDSDVAEIRSALADGQRQGVIAKRHGVSQSMISRIALGKARHA